MKTEGPSSKVITGYCKDFGSSQSGRMTTGFIGMKIEGLQGVIS